MASLLLALAVLGIALLFLYFTNPLMHETFTVAWDHDIIKELNLKSGEHVSIWLWTATPLSMQNAGGRVIRFYVTDPHARVIAGYMPGISGTGFFTPFTFVAHQDGVYAMHFENSIGDPDSRTVSLYYRIALSILGIPIEYVVICIMAIVIVVTVFFGIVFALSKERTARFEVNPSHSRALTQARATLFHSRLHYFCLCFGRRETSAARKLFIVPSSSFTSKAPFASTFSAIPMKTPS